MEELKRCPFCGQSPICGVEFYESHGSEVKLAAVVQCPHCHIERRIVFKATELTSLVPFWDYEKAFDMVVNRWNERADDE